ncbi:MAG TPA: hypothetical protein VFD92_28565 [Candidatus Binatia bacterium]|nr:hypothetical protein [Candidatus Binatia bacterium]
MWGSEPAVAEEGLHDLLVPELITPDQHGDRTRAELVDHPAARLMLAVMEDAIATFKRHAAAGPDRRSRRLFDEVDSWIQSTDDEPLYSFERICATLHFDPAYIRTGLERWRAQYLATDGARRPATFRRMNARRHRIGGRERRLRATG